MENKYPLKSYQPPNQSNVSGVLNGGMSVIDSISDGT